MTSTNRVALRTGHHRLLVATGAVIALALVASCGGSDSDTAATSDASTTTSTGPDQPVACDVDPGDDPSRPARGAVGRLVDRLVAEARLPEAERYTDFRSVCDNVDATSLTAPEDYDYVEPTGSTPPQSVIRVGRDFLGPVEEGPVIALFAAPVGGDQFPTRPRNRRAIAEVVDGSLSTGTRDPREGETIAEDCSDLPVQPFTTSEFTGVAQFYVNCGRDPRAWVVIVADPTNGDPYFIRVLAQVLDTADADALGRALETMAVDTRALRRFARESATTTTTTTTATARPRATTSTTR